MRAPSPSVDSPGARPSRTFTLPDADVVTAAWTDQPPADGFPTRPDKAKTFSKAMLALGVTLLLFVPVAAVLLLVAGGLGLTIATEATATTATQPQS